MKNTREQHMAKTHPSVLRPTAEVGKAKEQTTAKTHPSVLRPRCVFGDIPTMHMIVHYAFCSVIGCLYAREPERFRKCDNPKFSNQTRVRYKMFFSEGNSLMQCYSLAPTFCRDSLYNMTCCRLDLRRCSPRVICVKC